MRIFIAFIALITTTSLMAQDYQAEWDSVTYHQDRGRYRTALEKLVPIIEQAKADDNVDQLAKAYFWRAANLRNLEEDGTVAAIEQLQGDLAESEREAIQALLELQLAKGFRAYTQERLYATRDQTGLLEDDESVDDATATEQPLPEWSTERLARQFLHHALQSIEIAQDARLPLERIDAIVSSGQGRETEISNLFDLIVYEVLEELDNGLSVLPEPVEAFRPAEVQLFEPVRAFLRYRPNTADTTNANYRSLQVYQRLLSVRLEEASISDYHRPALVHADLSRLRWAHQLTGRNQLYRTSLERLLVRHAAAPNAGDIALALAQLLNQNEEFWGETEEERRLHLARDRQRYLELIEAYPDTRAAQEAQRAIDRIVASNLTVMTEEVNIPDESVLVYLRYANIDQLHYRLLTFDFALDAYDINYDQEDKLTEYLAQNPLQRGSYDLAANDDYQPHTTEFSLDDLAAGGYRLLVSDNADFSFQDGHVNWVDFTVSNLAYMQLEQNGGSQGYQVVNRTTGSPVAGATLERFNSKRRNGRQTYLRRLSLQTDQRGQLEIPINNQQLVDRLSYEGDTLLLNLQAYRQYEPDFAQFNAHFFFDRAIYRPGQRMYAKVLVVSKDRAGMPSLVTNQDFDIKLYDANGEEVAQLTEYTDQYGAIKLEFELPTGRLSGRWRVQIDGIGSQSLRVEEYKRPRFEIELPPLEEPAVLGDSVTVTGQALAYSGPPLADARVSYRVERQVRWWSYRWWGGGGPGTTEAIMAQGETTTDAEGRFEIDFLAEVAEQRDQRYRPYYSFRVYVDVSDQTGETHAAEANVAVQQPYAQLRISLPGELDRSDDDANLRLILPPGNEADWELRITAEAVTHPDPATRSRRWSVPDRPLMSRRAFKSRFPDMIYEEVAPVEEWTSAGSNLFRAGFSIDADSSLALPIENWSAGHYRIRVSYLDGEGERQNLYAHLALSDLNSNELPAGTFAKLEVPTEQLPVGARGNIRLVHQPRRVASLWGWANREEVLELNQENLSEANSFAYNIERADRGGKQFFLQYVYRNRYYQHQVRLNVPWRDRELAIEYETFRDRLRPGEPETWTLRVSDADGDSSPAEAQVLASMYDASLDALTNHQWQMGQLFPSLYTRLPQAPQRFSTRTGVQLYQPSPGPRTRPYSLPRFDFGPLSWDYRNRFAVYRTLSADVPQAYALEEAEMSSAPPPPPPAPANVRGSRAEANNYYVDGVEVAANESSGEGDAWTPRNSADGGSGGQAPVALRTNLQETAFFQPELLTDAEGRVSIRFTSPEALTSWKFQVLAHTSDLSYALSSRELKTQKELMILPNAPRFLREGDRIRFTAKVSNLSEQMLLGSAELELFDLETEERIDGEFGLSVTAVPFRIDPTGSQSVQWEINVPAGAADRGEIGYRVIARAGEYSDGEQDRLPILTNRIFLTSTESFYLRSNDRKTVTLDALANAQSPSLRHSGYSLEVTSNPAWLAVKSLPYLVEYPYNCSEQLVNRYFANQLSHHIVRGKPTWRTVFEQWQGDSTALLSELERNQDLKMALLEETPWLREAESEREQRRRLGLLFDLEAVAARQEQTWNELAARQQSGGGFSWMPGGRVSPYITAYVMESLGRLQALGALNQNEQQRMDLVIERGLGFLDDHRRDAFNRWLRGRELTDSLAATYRPSSTEVHYYYLRSFYGDSADGNQGGTDPDSYRGRKYEISENLRTYWDLLAQRLHATWLDRNLYEQALAATAFAWDGKADQAREIMTSLRERALRNDELGMHWPYGRGFRWYELPIETHTRLMEAFLVNGASTQEMDELRLWLLQNKRTNRWSSTKSTAAAVYALLQNGGDWLSEPNIVSVNLPDAPRELWTTELAYAQNRPEAGTGYYRVSLPAESVSPQLARVEVNNDGNSVAWGAIYWQFTEDIDQVRADADGPLALQRRLFRRVNTNQGERLEPITDATELQTGDRLRVQLVVTVDREMDFVHLKDRRAAGLEPTEQLSGYRYQAGLGYYFNPTDLAVNFFFDQLPRGTHTLEYDLFVTQEGDFSNGLSQVQCMYAPEFGAYSAGSRLVVD